MILQPSEMDFSNKNFSMIISGSPGIGKTTLALSAPDPVLIDFDKGISRVRAQHRKAAIVCDTYEEVLKDIQSPEVKAAKTLVLDTGGAFITYLQDWAMRDNPALNQQKNGAISLKGFGAVKSEFVRFTNVLQYTMNKNIIYIFHTMEERDKDITKQRLMCEGAARNIVWQPCDLGCFVQMVGDKRFCGFSPTEEYFAKGCYGITGLIEVPELSSGTPNDFITRLFDRARENIAAESAQNAKEMMGYDQAMKNVRAIMAEVVDAETANQAAGQMRDLQHHLTSEREGRELFRAKVKELGLTYNKQEQRYE
ncbi:ATP-binding protein [Anaerofilum sp. BX8]|uniref:ATP-binding protein n=1 Tax=Anaerofilum hominis TaxID=2763016 RepID=A0A923L0Q3_9FIRM|nr:ATP-binding protein [Anaerofilum hominis]MBC5580895.1 ATP-binding protein [Anaerofilum hominis]